jgi:hypothetical protein
VEEDALEHDPSGALLLMYRFIEHHPIVCSWLSCSMAVLQARP